MIDVSVITAAWNAEATITQAIISALSQSGVSVEVIVADDASTDATGHVVQGFGNPRVRYLRIEANGGPAAARNAAIAQARGRWIAILDADDTMIPGRLAGLVAVAEANCLDIVMDNMMIEDAAGRRRLFIPEALDAAVEFVSLAPYVAGNRLFGNQLGQGYLKPVFATEFLGKHKLHYDTATRIGEDFMLVAEALTLGARCGRTRTAGYVYTASSGSISHRLNAHDAEAMVAADKRYLARHGPKLGKTELAAWQAHLRSLEEGASFVAMVESLKAGDAGRFIRSWWRSPVALRHFSMPVAARVERVMRRIGRPARVIGA